MVKGAQGQWGWAAVGDGVFLQGKACVWEARLAAQRHLSQGEGAFQEHCSEKPLLKMLSLHVPFS